MPKSKKRKTHHPTSTGSHGELSHAEIWDDSALIRSWNDAEAEYEYYHSIHARGEDVDEVLRQAEAEEEQQQQRNQQGDVDIDVDVDEGDARPETFDIDEEPEDGEIEDDEAGTDIGIIANGGSRQKFFEAQPGVSNSSNQSRLPTQASAKADSTLTSDKNTTLLQPVSAPASASASVPVPATGPRQPGTASQGTNTILAQSQTKGQPSIDPANDQTLENIKMAYYWAGYYSGLYDGQKQTASLSSLSS